MLLRLPDTKTSSASFRDSIDVLWPCYPLTHLAKEADMPFAVSSNPNKTIFPDQNTTPGGFHPYKCCHSLFESYCEYCGT